MTVQFEHFDFKEINTLRLYAKERREIYEETERFLSIQVAENKETEFKTRQREKQLAHLKEEKQKFTDTIDSYTVEVERNCIFMTLWFLLTFLMIFSFTYNKKPCKI